MNRKGILVVISGFSGVGKGTLVRRLMERYKEQYALSVSATTREPREGEQDGREYFFRKKEEFEKLIADDELLEYASYCGNYYGTPKAYVEDQMAQGRDVILEIELQGALKIKEKRPDTFLVYVMPPDARTLVDRLTRALEEADEVAKYEFVVINDDLDRSAEELHQLIEVQHNKIDRNLEFISQVQRELKAYLKGEQ